MDAWGMFSIIPFILAASFTGEEAGTVSPLPSPASSKRRSRSERK